MGSRVGGIHQEKRFDRGVFQLGKFLLGNIPVEVLRSGHIYGDKIVIIDVRNLQIGREDRRGMG